MAPQQARIVELRFFGGLTIEETAEVLDVSPATVKRDWTWAKAWLYQQLSRPMSVEPPDWTRVKAIFDAAVVLDVACRSAYLEDACGTDDLLRRHVEALLLAHDRADRFLETPAAVLIDRSADELIGRTVDSYRIVERIGAGGMGEVSTRRTTRSSIGRSR